MGEAGMGQAVKRVFWNWPMVPAVKNLALVVVLLSQRTSKRSRHVTLD
jgi:hypothetical protein